MDAATPGAYYDELAALINDHAITVESIWNVDVTGIDLNKTHTPVYGHRSLAPAVHSDSAPHDSLVACVSASGATMAPLFIFSSKKTLPGDLLDDVSRSCYVSASESGFMNTRLWQSWMTNFCSTVDASRLKTLPRLQESEHARRLQIKRISYSWTVFVLITTLRPLQ